MEFTSLSIAWKRHEREGRGYPLTAQSIRLDLSPSKLVKELAKLPKTGLPVTWNVDNATLFFLNCHFMHWNYNIFYKNLLACDNTHHRSVFFIGHNFEFIICEFISVGG